MDPKEYRAAIVELSQVARTLADLKARNPKRYEVALDAWKAKSRVELIAARLAGSPSEELQSQLRLAIEAKVDAEIRRHRFELEQAEAAARKARPTSTAWRRTAPRSSRTAIAPLPRKCTKARKPAEIRPKTKPEATTTPNPEDRG